MTIHTQSFLQNNFLPTINRVFFAPLIIGGVLLAFLPQTTLSQNDLTQYIDRHIDVVVVLDDSGSMTTCWP